MSNSKSKFQLLLENHHNFPCSYTFKLIAQPENYAAIRALFAPYDAAFTEKHSDTKKYVSLSIVVHMPSSAEVMKIYAEAQKINGVIAL